MQRLIMEQYFSFGEKVMINPKCKIISISHEDIIRNVLHLDDNILRKVTNIKDLAVVITPDATLGQPQKLLLAGVKMQIIWYLQNVKMQSLKKLKLLRGKATR